MEDTLSSGSSELTYALTLKKSKVMRELLSCQARKKTMIDRMLLKLASDGRGCQDALSALKLSQGFLMPKLGPGGHEHAVGTAKRVLL